MEIVIKIPKWIYTLSKHIVKTDKKGNLITRAIANGTPLPKGHGDLIDKSKLEVCPIDITDLPTDRCLMVYLADDVDNAKVIIDADRSEE